MSVKYTFKIKNIVYLKINTLIIKKIIVFFIKSSTFSKSNITSDNFNKMIKNMIIFCQGVMYYEKN